MQVDNILKLLNEKIAPAKLAYEYDNVGLLIGDKNTVVTKILLALDISDEVITQAIEQNAQLIITHHPLIFKPIKNILADDRTGKLIQRLIKHDISYIAMHTNLDRAPQGVNDTLAGLFELSDCRTIVETQLNHNIKFAVYVPRTHTGQIIAVLERLNITLGGNYSACSFSFGGVGRFKPNDKAQPYIGAVDKLTSVEEEKIEFLLPKTRLEETLVAIKAVHPYEEIAYEVQDVLNCQEKIGILRIGKLTATTTAEQLAHKIKNILGLTGVKLSGKNKQISTVAVCGGSGSSLLSLAKSSGADILVTGDVGYHDAQTAQGLDIALLDIGHQESELPVLKTLALRLTAMLPDIPITIAKEQILLENI